MDIRNSRALKDAAGARLAQAQYDPRKLALLHTAISLGAALVIALIDYYLNHQINMTGGLSGMGLRSLLGTVQTTLQYALSVALPFWEMGFLYAALRLARGQQADFSSLPEGFRRFGPVLRLRLLEGILFAGLAMACMYAGSFLFMLTPAAARITEIFLPMLESGSMEQIEAAIAQIPLEELMGMMAPFFAIFGVLFVLIGAVMFYRFRVADFLIMDQPRTGALQALIGSSRMTRRRRWALLKLDLSFWWFYLLLALSAAVSYADVLLARVGVTLPISSDLAQFAFYILGMLMQLVLYWRAFSYVQTTYATAYEVLRQQPAEEPAGKAPTKALPWDDYNNTKE